MHGTSPVYECSLSADAARVTHSDEVFCAVVKRFAVEGAEDSRRGRRQHDERDQQRGGKQLVDQIPPAAPRENRGAAEEPADEARRYQCDEKQVAAPEKQINATKRRCARVGTHM